MKKRNKTPHYLLSVIIPAFNETASIIATLTAIAELPLQPIEVIVVDDCSTDQTVTLVKKHPQLYTKLIQKNRNEGKGAAVRDGIAQVHGDIVIIQDADLEYSPTDYPKLVGPIIQDVADVVYGSRFVGGEPHRVAYFWHYVGNVLLTCLSNMFTNLNLTDMETGYKAFRRDLIQSIFISEQGFGIEPELTAKLAARKPRFYEVGIAYHGRTYEEGKKIGLRDFFRAIWVIVKFGLQFAVQKPPRYHHVNHE